MKFCPYCGEDLLDSNVVFCGHCGKKLPPHEAGITEPLTEEKRPKPAVPLQNEPPKKEKKRKKEKKSQPKKVAESAEVIPVDDGYDGYYDDILPPDLDREREGLDKELIKKVVALGVGIIFIIAMCVVMMYVL